MLTAVVFYIVCSYIAVGWFVHTHLDGLLKVVGWLLWLASPVVFPALAIKALVNR